METHLWSHCLGSDPPINPILGGGKFTHPFGLIREAVAQNEMATVVYFYLYSKL